LCTDISVFHTILTRNSYFSANGVRWTGSVIEMYGVFRDVGTEFFNIVSCRPVTVQRPVNGNRGMVFSVRSSPMAAHATVDTATDERCFLCGLCQDVICRAVGVSVVEWSELVGELVRGLLRFSPCELLLLEAGSWGRGQFGNTGRGTSAVGSRYQTTTGEDTADWEDLVRVTIPNPVCSHPYNIIWANYGFKGVNTLKTANNRCSFKAGKEQRLEASKQPLSQESKHPSNKPSSQFVSLTTDYVLAARSRGHMDGRKSRRRNSTRRSADLTEVFVLVRPISEIRSRLLLSTLFSFHSTTSWHWALCNLSYDNAVK
jgi:hypothetical protein